MLNARARIGEIFLEVQKQIAQLLCKCGRFPAVREPGFMLRFDKVGPKRTI